MTATKFSAKAAADYRSRFGIDPTEAAGLRSLTHARSNGALVGVYDGIPAGHDTEGGRWQTVCESHGSICSHDTLGLARSFAADPEAWCEPCQDGEPFDSPACHACGGATMPPSAARGEVDYYCEACGATTARPAHVDETWAALVSAS